MVLDQNVDINCQLVPFWHRKMSTSSGILERSQQSQVVFGSMLDPKIKFKIWEESYVDLGTLATITDPSVSLKHLCGIKAYVNQAGSHGHLPMLIGWNGLLLVDTSAMARPVAKHPFSYLNTCKCHFFTIAIKARKKIVMTTICSQCAISQLKM